VVGAIPGIQELRDTLWKWISFMSVWHVVHWLGSWRPSNL